MTDILLLLALLFSTFLAMPWLVYAYAILRVSAFRADIEHKDGK